MMFEVQFSKPRLSFPNQHRLDTLTSATPAQGQGVIRDDLALWGGIKGRLFSCWWWLKYLHPKKTAKQDLPSQGIDIKHKSTILQPGSTFRPLRSPTETLPMTASEGWISTSLGRIAATKIKSRLRGSGGCKLRGNLDNWYSLITSWGRYQTPTHFTIPEFRK